MKYIIVLGDGMADEPITELGGRTPLACAATPVMDCLAQKAEIGLVSTIPEGMKPGSDTANLSVLGYDPRIYYSGRSPLEALSIGVKMEESDVALRCNFVTISEEDTAFENQTITDHSSDEISTEDCAVLLEAVRPILEDELHKLYLGTSYRHCLIRKNGKADEEELTPPHDILGRVIGGYLPKEEGLRRRMEESYRILKDHPLNKERMKNGLRPANCCWFWGAGTKPVLVSFEEKTGKKGMMISAVDLLKGIAVGAGMGVAHVEGANGGLHTNYAGKTEAALKAVLQDGYDFVYIHIEAPDEMGHQGSVEKKVKAIEYLDGKVIGPLTRRLDQEACPYRLLIMPDHPTPVRVRTHTSDSVPYMLYDSTKPVEGIGEYSEEAAGKSGILKREGHKLIEELFLNE